MYFSINKNMYVPTLKNYDINVILKTINNPPSCYTYSTRIKSYLFCFYTHLRETIGHTGKERSVME